MRAAMIVVVVTGLAGCAPGPMSRPFIPLAATPTTFVVELYGDLIINGPLGGVSERYQAAVEAADRHCAGYGKTARLVSETPGRVFDRRRLQFACQ